MAKKYILAGPFYGKFGEHYNPDPNGVYLPDYETPPKSAQVVDDSYRGVEKRIKYAAKVSPFGIQGPTGDDAPPVKVDTKAEAKAEVGLGDDGAGQPPAPGKDAAADDDAELARLVAARNRVAETPAKPGKGK